MSRILPFPTNAVMCVKACSRYRVSRVITTVIAMLKNVVTYDVKISHTFFHEDFSTLKISQRNPRVAYPNSLSTRSGAV